MDSLDNIVDFLFETGILAKTPRSGFHFLGTGSQSVAEHITRTAFIGYVLASMEEGVDSGRVVKMCLLHDLPEARTSDLNYLHQKYAHTEPEKAMEDLSKPLPFGPDMKALVEEFEKRETQESKLAKDADNLEWILSMKEQMDQGNQRAGEWMEIAIKRLKTDSAKSLAERIRRIDSNHWFFSQKDDPWWVNRNKTK